METFIAIHNDGIVPTFTSFPTVVAAETYLNELLNTRRVSACDSLAIVRSSDDKIIYFKEHDNTLDTLRAGLHHRANVLRWLWSSIVQQVEQLVPIRVEA